VLVWHLIAQYTLNIPSLCNGLNPGSALFVITLPMKCALLLILCWHSQLNVSLTAGNPKDCLVDSTQASTEQDSASPSSLSPASSILPASVHSDSIVFVVRGLRNRDGRLLVLLFKDSAGFPGESDLALAEVDASIDSDSVVVSFGGLAPGSYAASVVHDENDNGAMDTGLFGIPKEGYGASRDARKPFAPPAYEDAAFSIPSASVVQRITLVYAGLSAGAR